MLKGGQPWPYHVYDLTNLYFKVMTIAVHDMQFEDAKAQCLLWRKLNTDVERKGWVRSCSKGSWRIVCKQIGMLFALIMGLEILWSRWLTKSGCGFSIGFSFSTNVINSCSHESSMINIKPFVTSSKKPRPWKKLTFSTLPFGLGATH